MWWLLACTADRELLVVHVAPEHEALVASSVRSIGDDRVEVRDDVATARAGRDAVHVFLVDDPTACAECFSVEADRGWTVRGGGVLGLQYGLAEVLERQGYRFLHPFRTHLPEVLLAPEPVAREDFAPEQARRGLHLHTLHPIEGLQAVWEGGTTNELRSRAIFDWVVRNRGNQVQWVALDDIQRDPLVAEGWRAHTAALLAGAHERGLTVGIGVQLFGVSNLQAAWDLLDEVGTPEEQAEEMDRRLATLVGDLPWDHVSLSFGEFFGEDPETFLESTDIARQRIQAALPEATLSATIHVGNYDDLLVEYQGEELLYYFLVKHADPAVVPWIHSVMYYNLFEDAGGAYLHEEFDVHRQFLLDRLAAGEPVGYHPESAYWVAFDNPVPTYLPVYLRSRWLDLAEVRALGPPVDDHVLFSSGWEWGYWQTDAATLRYGYTFPDTWDAPVRHFYAPWGEDGAALAQAVSDLGELQHDALIIGRLAPWLAGRDAVIDLGDDAGILSQPDRPSVAELLELDAAGRADVLTGVIEPLHALADATEAIHAGVAGLRSGDPWFEEVRDGLVVDAARARFAAELWGAVLTAAEGGDPLPGLARADAALAAGTDAVRARHAALWHPDGATFIADAWSTATIYDYGYLREADELCFWHRERAQVWNAVAGGTESVPPCIF